MNDETVEEIAARLQISLEEARRIKRAYHRADVADVVEVSDGDRQEAERIRHQRGQGRG